MYWNFSLLSVGNRNDLNLSSDTVKLMLWYQIDCWLPPLFFCFRLIVLRWSPPFATWLVPLAPWFGVTLSFLLVWKYELWFVYQCLYWWESCFCNTLPVDGILYVRMCSWNCMFPVLSMNPFIRMHVFLVLPVTRFLDDYVYSRGVVTPLDDSERSKTYLLQIFT